MSLEGELLQGTGIDPFGPDLAPVRELDRSQAQLFEEERRPFFPTGQSVVLRTASGKRRRFHVREKGRVFVVDGLLGSRSRELCIVELVYVDIPGPASGDESAARDTPNYKVFQLKWCTNDANYVINIEGDREKGYQLHLRTKPVTTGKRIS